MFHCNQRFPRYLDRDAAFDDHEKRISVISLLKNDLALHILKSMNIVGDRIFFTGGQIFEDEGIFYALLGVMVVLYRHFLHSSPEKPMGNAKKFTILKSLKSR